MPSSQFPPALKRILPYLQRANEIESKSPLVAYYCRTWAAQKGIEIIQSLEEKDEEATQYLLSLMDRLEQDKAKGIRPDDEEGEKLIITVAMQLFVKADKAEKTGAIDWSIIAKLFYSSSIIMDVIQQFHEMPEDLKDKQRYARWKAAEIQKALKAGTTPTPSGTKSEEEQDGEEKQVEIPQDNEIQQEQQQEFKDTSLENQQFPSTESHSFGSHQSNQSDTDNNTTGFSQNDFSTNDYWNSQYENNHQTEKQQSNADYNSGYSNNESAGASYSDSPSSKSNDQSPDYSMFSNNNNTTSQSQNQQYYSQQSSDQSYQQQQQQQPHSQQNYQTSYQRPDYQSQQFQSNQQHHQQQPSQQQNYQSQQYQNRQQYQSSQLSNQNQQSQPQQSSSASASSTNSFTPSSKKEPSIDEMMTAQKHAKYAVSALQFNDSKTAVKELSTALKALNAL